MPWAAQWYNHQIPPFCCLLLGRAPGGCSHASTDTTSTVPVMQSFLLLLLWWLRDGTFSARSTRDCTTVNKIICCLAADKMHRGTQLRQNSCTDASFSLCVFAFFCLFLFMQRVIFFSLWTQEPTLKFQFSFIISNFLITEISISSSQSGQEMTSPRGLPMALPHELTDRENPRKLPWENLARTDLEENRTEGFSELLWRL